jgi:hypothetical protein
MTPRRDTPVINYVPPLENWVPVESVSDRQIPVDSPSGILPRTRQTSEAPPISPTAAIYASLETAFNFLNDRLFEPFGHRLPPCLITLPRRGRLLGYFTHEQYITRDGREFADEIGLDSRQFHTTPIKDVLSTLVHEMVHCEQQRFGKPSVRHHNREFSKWMGRVGLITSDTGAPGGRSIGRNMSEYTEPGGLFDRTCDELLASGWVLDWAAVEAPKQSKRSASRVAYHCEQCSAVLWGVASLRATGIRPSCDRCR